MRNRYTVVVQRDGKWFTAFCPEVPGANGQGRTKTECLKSLTEAIKLMREIQREELASLARRGAEQHVLELA